MHAKLRRTCILVDPVLLGKRLLGKSTAATTPSLVLIDYVLAKREKRDKNKSRGGNHPP